MKEVWYSDKVLIEGADAATLAAGDTVTLLNWGNVVVTKVTRYMCITMATGVLSPHLSGRLEAE